MRRDEFDHAIRAAGGVLGVEDLLVIGSQAVYASLAPADVPAAALRSAVVDVAVLGDIDGHRSDLIDGSIGEASMFHETFGYYARGVSPSTAVAPEGWRDRLVRYETPGTAGVVAWCLEEWPAAVCTASSAAPAAFSPAGLVSWAEESPGGAALPPRLHRVGEVPPVLPKQEQDVS